MRDFIFKIVDRISCGLAHPYTIVILLVSYLVWLLAFPFVPFGVWQLIMDIPVAALGFVILMFLNTAQDRDNKAINTKLDVILEHLEETEATGIETNSESEVQRLHARLAPSSGESADG